MQCKIESQAYVYNSTFVFKQHCLRDGARITLYCSIIQNCRGWIYEKLYFKSAYVFNLFKSFSPMAREESV